MTKEDAKAQHAALIAVQKSKIQDAITANEAVAEFERVCPFPLPTAVFPISRTQFELLESQRAWW